MLRHLWIWNKVSLNVCSLWASFRWQRSNTSVMSWETIIKWWSLVSLQSWLYLLVSGVVVVDITDSQLVLVLALLDIILTLGHLVLQLPDLQTSVISQADTTVWSHQHSQSASNKYLTAVQNLPTACRDWRELSWHWDPHWDLTAVQSNALGWHSKFANIDQVRGERGALCWEIKIASEQCNTVTVPQCHRHHHSDHHHLACWCQGVKKTRGSQEEKNSPHF